MSRAKRTKSFSARFSAEVVDMLDARSHRLGQSKARVAERLIEEGLRIEELPGIVFRSGPTRWRRLHRRAYEGLAKRVAKLLAGIAPAV